MKEIIKGFKRGLLWCAVILSGILVVAIINIIAELYKYRYDPPKGAMF